MSPVTTTTTGGNDELISIPLLHRDLCLKALNRCHTNFEKAASLLGITTTRLLKLIAKHKITWDPISGQYNCGNHFPCIQVMAKGFVLNTLDANHEILHIDHYRKRNLLGALNRHKNTRLAAITLGISLRTANRWIYRFGIKKDRYTMSYYIKNTEILAIKKLNMAS